MTAIASAANGNWSATGSWTPAQKPVAGDTVTITHAITVDEASACRSIDLDGGGSIVFNFNMTFDDNSAANLTIRSDAVSITSGGTASSPIVLASASATPTNRWYIRCEDQTTIPDSRTINFDFCELRGNKAFLGNDTYPVDFNGGAANDPILVTATPLTREPTIIEHPITQRTRSRVYMIGESAGSVTLEGSCTLDSYLPTTIKNMVASLQRVAFFGDRTYLHGARVERYTFRRIPGLYYDFSITLIEDL